MSDVANWIIGFISAIIVMFVTELYKEKKEEKKEKLRTIREVLYFIRHYRERFTVIKDHIDKGVRSVCIWKNL